MIKKQKNNFLNWSVLGNAEIKKVCYKEFSLGQGIFSVQIFTNMKNYSSSKPVPFAFN